MCFPNLKVIVFCSHKCVIKPTIEYFRVVVLKIANGRKQRLLYKQKLHIPIRSVLILLFGALGVVLQSKAATVGLNDPKATANAKAVYAYLNALGNTGKVLSGQQGVVRNFDHTTEFDIIQGQTGSKPAILGLDYFHWTEHGLGYQFDYATSNAKAKAHWNAGGLIKMSSHVYNPITGQSGNTNVAAFPSNIQVGQMMVEGTPENITLKTLLDRITGGLADLQNSGVVVIYAPWHEWNFWWSGNNGISDPNLKALWRYTRNYIVGQGDT